MQPLFDLTKDPAAAHRFYLQGELSFQTAMSCLQHGSKLLASTSESDLEIDLAKVTRCDSAGLAILIEWLRLAKKYNKTLRFCHFPASLVAIARVSGLEQVFS